MIYVSKVLGNNKYEVTYSDGGAEVVRIVTKKELQKLCSNLLKYGQRVMGVYYGEEQYITGECSVRVKAIKMNSSVSVDTLRKHIDAVKTAYKEFDFDLRNYPYLRYETSVCELEDLLFSLSYKCRLTFSKRGILVARTYRTGQYRWLWKSAFSQNEGTILDFIDFLAKTDFGLITIEEAW